MLRSLLNFILDIFAVQDRDVKMSEITFKVPYTCAYDLHSSIKTYHFLIHAPFVHSLTITLNHSSDSAVVQDVIIERAPWVDAMQTINTLNLGGRGHIRLHIKGDQVYVNNLDIDGCDVSIVSLSYL